MTTNTLPFRHDMALFLEFRLAECVGEKAPKALLVISKGFMQRGGGTLGFPPFN